MKRKILMSLLFCSAFLVKAQDIDKRPFIEITGTSETDITPDEIYITITLQEKGDSKERSIEKQEEDLKSNLKELNIELNNLMLSTANADFRKIKAFKKDVVTSKSFLLKVNSADMVDNVYKRLDKINVFDAYISKLNHSKITDLTAENREKAVIAAKKKAQTLAQAVGNNIGAPISIIESVNTVDANPFNSNYNYYGGRYAGNVAQSYSSPEFSENGGDDISFKKIKLRSSFLVRYELK